MECLCVNQQQQSVSLSELHRKSQLWRGIVSIALIKGQNLFPMDPNGLSDPYVKFRLGPQKYRSKVCSHRRIWCVCMGRGVAGDLPTGGFFFFLCVQTVPKTLCPQWREQFDLHLYEEAGGVLDITVWDRDTGRRDDFIGRSVARCCWAEGWLDACAGVATTQSEQLRDSYICCVFVQLPVGPFHSKEGANPSPGAAAGGVAWQRGAAGHADCLSPRLHRRPGRHATGRPTGAQGDPQTIRKQHFISCGSARVETIILLSTFLSTGFTEVTIKL